MTEEQLLQAVRSLARLLGWLSYHTRDSRRSDPGFVDLMLAKPPRLILAELKTEKGQLTEAQRAWGNALLECPQVEYAVWRPSHWSRGIIERILRGERA